MYNYFFQSAKQIIEFKEFQDFSHTKAKNFEILWHSLAVIGGMCEENFRTVVTSKSLFRGTVSCWQISGV